MQRFVYCLILGVVLPFCAVYSAYAVDTATPAQPNNASTVANTPTATTTQHGAYENTTGGAKSFVENTSKRVITLLKDGKSSSAKEKQLTDIFLSVMDIDWIGKYVLGRQWQSLTESQKIEYLRQYKKFIISSYVPLFKEYNGQRLEVRWFREIGDGQYMVNTNIVSADSPDQNYTVEYRLKFYSSEFKIRDIVGEGVSMLATQRADFSSIFANGGFEALMNKLREKST